MEKVTEESMSIYFNAIQIQLPERSKRNLQAQIKNWKTGPLSRVIPKLQEPADEEIMMPEVSMGFELAKSGE